MIISDSLKEELIDLLVDKTLEKISPFNEMINSYQEKIDSDKEYTEKQLKAIKAEKEQLENKKDELIEDAKNKADDLKKSLGDKLDKINMKFESIKSKVESIPTTITSIVMCAAIWTSAPASISDIKNLITMVKGFISEFQELITQVKEIDLDPSMIPGLSEYSEELETLFNTLQSKEQEEENNENTIKAKTEALKDTKCPDCNETELDWVEEGNYDDVYCKNCNWTGKFEDCGRN